ncbi:hypothetical protein DMUE_2699 [Dictyocoela muelleri]|nr:hypothetical protein DMUE_2699 [Dictyocoela muelleri]
MISYKKIFSKRGKAKIICKGFIYNFDYKSKTRDVYRCSDRACRGRIYIDEKNNIIKEIDHSHFSEENKIKKLEFQNTIKKFSENTNENFDTCLRNALLKFDFEDIRRFGSIKNIRDQFSLNRRNKQFGVLNNNEDEILESLKYTYDKSRFLQFDEGVGESRLVILFTNNNLTILSKSKILLMDATFKSAPKKFSQLFVIHALHFNKRIPLVYCLCGSKSANMYSKIFSVICERSNIQPESIICDFEVGLSKAISQKFPTANIYGCYFHFSQIMWRRVIKDGNVCFYKENYNFRKIFHYLLFLAYVPIEKVKCEFYKLKELFSNQERISGLFTFFEKNFIINEDKIANKTVNFWNINSRIKKIYQLVRIV